MFLSIYDGWKLERCCDNTNGWHSIYKHTWGTKSTNQIEILKINSSKQEKLQNQKLINKHTKTSITTNETKATLKHQITNRSQPKWIILNRKKLSIYLLGFKSNERTSFDKFFRLFCTQTNTSVTLESDECSMEILPNKPSERASLLLLFFIQLRSLKTFEQHWCLFLRLKPYIYYGVGISLFLSLPHSTFSVIFKLCCGTTTT